MAAFYWERRVSPCLWQRCATSTDVIRNRSKVQRQSYKVHCDYSHINALQLLCEKQDVMIINQHFVDRVAFELGIRDDKLTAFEQALIERFSGQLQLERE